MIKSVQQISFRSYIPIHYYAKNPKTDKYVPVIRNENIKKCHSFVVRNLNGTAKNMKNDEFVAFYRNYDYDYRRTPKVHSVYDRDNPIVYLISGQDVDTVRELAKPIGKAKSEAVDRLGHSKSFEAQIASNDFFRNVKHFLRTSCRRLKSKDNKNLSLNVFFDPKYNKKNKLVGFNYVGASFTEDKK